MDREQQERFRAAVESKNQEAEARSRAGAAEHASGGPVDDDQGARADPRTGQDVAEREKSSRHGQVTADKWNQ